MREEDQAREVDAELKTQQAVESKARCKEIDQLEHVGDMVTPPDSDAASEASSKESEVVVTTKDYVAATLSAWNNCPGIVKK